MRTPRLFNLGCALLAFGVGLPALAEELPVAASSEQAAEVAQEVVEAAPVESAPETDLPMEAAAEIATDLPEAAAEPAALPVEPVADMAEAVSDISDVSPPAAQAEAPLAAESASMPVEPASMAVETAAMQLGAVGYDDQGREGRIHVVSPGDTLWDISDGYLGTPWVWPSIWSDNRNIENPHLIFPGDRIWITPWEMRKLTPSEADAMLAGKPAAADSVASLDAPVAIEAPVEVSPPAAMAPVVDVAPQEQVMVTIPNRERVGLVTEAALDASASVLANVAPRLMISQDDRVWVGMAEGDTRVGDQYTIFRVEEKIYDPESGRALGYHVAQLGWLEIVETHDESSLAVVKTSNSEIEVGDKLMPRAKTNDQIAVTGAGAGVEGQISFLPNSRTQVGTLDFVYLNRGLLDGVAVGTPLTVFRKGFGTRDEALDSVVQVPDRPVANLLVVRAEDEASVAVIRRTDEELVLGDHFRGASN